MRRLLLCNTTAATHQHFVPCCSSFSSLGIVWMHGSTTLTMMRCLATPTTTTTPEGNPAPPPATRRVLRPVPRAASTTTAPSSSASTSSQVAELQNVTPSAATSAPRVVAAASPPPLRQPPPPTETAITPVNSATTTTEDVTTTTIASPEKKRKQKRKTKMSKKKNGGAAESHQQQQQQQQAQNLSSLPPPDLSQEQRAAIRAAVEQRANIFVTGPAGTGKSVVIREIISQLNSSSSGSDDGSSRKIAVAGSTGIAASMIDGTTVHALFGISPSLQAQTIQELTMRKRAVQFLKSVDTIIVDEVSMLNGEVISIMDQTLRRAKSHIRKHFSPFGGVQMIFSGDFLQLPPVDGAFAFQSPAWHSASLQVHELKKSFRQSDQEFVDFLNLLRFGAIKPSHLSQLCKRASDSNNRPETSNSTPTTKKNQVVSILPTNRQVDAVNRKQLALLPLATNGKEHVFRAEIVKTSKKTQRKTSTEVDDDEVLTDLPIERDVALKVGARVLLVRNVDIKSGLVNGAAGTVVSFTHRNQEALPYVEFDGIPGRTLIRRAEIDIRRGDGTVRKTISQIPLKLGWAITAHKSQGMSISNVDITLSGTFEAGQAYVALSRARSLGGLRVTGAEGAKIAAHPLAVAFYEEAAKKKQEGEDQR